MAAVHFAVTWRGWTASGTASSTPAPLAVPTERREDTLQSDLEVEGEIRLAILVSEVPAGTGHGVLDETGRSIAKPAKTARRGIARGDVGRVAAHWRIARPGAADDLGGRGDGVGMRRDFLDVQRDGVHTAAGTRVIGRKTRPGRAAAGMDRHSAAQIGKRERGPTVAAIERPDEREQRRVLTDRQKLPVAIGPAADREIQTKQRDLADERFCHVLTPRE